MVDTLTMLKQFEAAEQLSNIEHDRIYRKLFNIYVLPIHQNNSKKPNN